MAGATHKSTNRQKKNNLEPKTVGACDVRGWNGSPLALKATSVLHSYMYCILNANQQDRSELLYFTVSHNGSTT